MSNPKPASRKKLLYALGYCVEALAIQSLMDGNGAISNAMATDPKVWDQIDQSTKDILSAGLGLTDPRTP